MVAIEKTSFVSGEISPALHGRIDVRRYDSGLARAENVFVRPHGGISNRAGTEFVAEVKDSTMPARLVPFTFNDQETYVLELGHHSLRVFQEGGRVVENAITITGATQASPAVLTATAHGLADGDELFLDGFTGMTELNSRVAIVANATADTVELNTKAGTPLDSTNYTAHSGTGQASRIYEITTPWEATELFDVNFVQSADVMYLVHPSHPPQKLSRQGHTDWALAAISFTPDVAAPASATVATAGLVPWKTGKQVLVGEPRSNAGKLYLSASDGNTGATAPIHTSGTETDGTVDWTFQDDLTTYKYKVTAISDKTGEESLPVLSNEVTTDLVTNGVKNTITWDPVTGASHYILYRDDNGVFGRIGGTEETTFVDQNITPDLSDTPPIANNPFPGDDNYPGCVDLFEQRLLFAGTNNRPRTIFMSSIGAFENFSTRNPSQDNDAVTVTLASSRVNRIRHLVDAGGDLLAFTANTEWSIKRGNNSDAITPTSLRLQVQSHFGAGRATPLPIGKLVLFPESKGKTVRTLAYEFATDGYNGNDIAILSDHLFEGREIVEWCYTQSPDGVVWLVMDDGVCLALTLQPEHKITGWTRMATDGVVESVCSVDEGPADRTYWLAQRTIDDGTPDGRTVRYVERMYMRDFKDMRDAHFVDAGLTHDGAPVSALSNLHHLEGKTLSALCDGNVVSGLVVENGRVTLPNPASKVHIGIPYTAEIETLPLEFPTETGTPQGRRKRLKSAIIRVRDTRGIQFGAPGTEPVELTPTPSADWQDPIDLLTGTIDQEIPPHWNRDGTLIIRQPHPLPMTVLGLFPDVEPGE